MCAERAAADFPLNGITSFGGSDSRFLSHQDLFDRSAAESKAIQGLLNLNDTGNRVVVLHTDDHLEGISVSRLRNLKFFLASRLGNCYRLFIFKFHYQLPDADNS